MSIDLHVHSVNSDGTDSTEAIIESSIELQLEAICIQTMNTSLRFLNKKI